VSQELDRLFAAAVVNSAFKEQLITTVTPEGIEGLTYMGESFLLTPEEAEMLTRAVANNPGNLAKVAAEIVQQMPGKPS
jgi:hypothetical protein